MKYNTKHIPALLKSINTINHHANDYLEANKNINYTDFVGYYHDYKYLISQYEDIDSRALLLINKLPDLFTYKVW